MLLTFPFTAHLDNMEQLTHRFLQLRLRPQWSLCERLLNQKLYYSIYKNGLLGNFPQNKKKKLTASLLSKVEVHIDNRITVSGRTKLI